jgi:uncharacterized protein YndB with AHSA1/START domain
VSQSEESSFVYVTFIRTTAEKLWSADTGVIVECERPKRIRLKWRNEFRPELKAEGYALCTIEIEPYGDAVRLSIAHTMERAGSKFIEAVSGGWPKILSNLKSLLETGKIVLGEAQHSHG